MNDMAATDHSGSRVSTGAAVYHPPLPPNYELDDYWIENIVLKDEKEAEDEFYYALGHCTNEKLSPHPPYVAARNAAAPPYNSVSSLLTKSTQPNDFAFSTDNAAAPPREKKNRAKNEKVVDLLGSMNHHPKHTRSASGYDCNSLSGSAAAATPQKKNNQKKEMDDDNVGVKNHKRKRHTSFNDSDNDYVPCRESEDHVKKQRLRIVIKKQEVSHPCSLSVENTTAAPAPASPHWVHDQHQQPINDVPPEKSVSPKNISAALPVLTANHMQVLPDRELITNLIAAKMGACGSLMLVIAKTLTRTDVDSGQNRLSIPHRQVQNDFLGSEEKDFLDCEQKSVLGCATIEVGLLIFDQHHQQQPCLDDDDEIKFNSIKLSNWKTNSMYVLKSSWISLVKQYQLQEGTNVQLWAFRNVHSNLCFALLRN